MNDAETRMFKLAGTGEDSGQKIRDLFAANPGLDVDKREGHAGATALHVAASRNRTDAVMALLDARPDVDARDDTYNHTPLMSAASYVSRFEDPPSAEENVCENPGGGWSPPDRWLRVSQVPQSVVFGNEVIKLLLDAGAGVLLINDEGETALDIAKRVAEGDMRQRHPAVEVLEGAMAKTTVRGKIAGMMGLGKGGGITRTRRRRSGKRSSRRVRRSIRKRTKRKSSRKSTRRNARRNARRSIRRRLRRRSGKRRSSRRR